MSNGYFDLHPKRMKELEGFCEQYKDWELRANCADSFSKMPQEQINKMKREHGDPVVKAAMEREYWTNKMDMVRRCCYEAGPSAIACVIFEAVTNGLSYEKLSARMTVPCGRRQFYEARKRFFWALNCQRG